MKLFEIKCFLLDLYDSQYKYLEILSIITASAKWGALFGDSILITSLYYAKIRSYLIFSFCFSLSCE